MREGYGRDGIELLTNAIAIMWWVVEGTNGGEQALFFEGNNIRKEKLKTFWEKYLLLPKWQVLRLRLTSQFKLRVFVSLLFRAVNFKCNCNFISAHEHDKQFKGELIQQNSYQICNIVANKIEPFSSTL